MSSASTVVALFVGLVSVCSAFNIVSKGPSIQTPAVKRAGASAVPMPIDKVAEVFRFFDKDGSGELDRAELKAAFEAMGRPASDETLAHSFSLIDRNHDGKIDLAEFRVMAEQNLMPVFAAAFAAANDHAFEANGDDLSELVSRARDEKLATENPKAWCADRCLATGYCDVLEDIYRMTTAQVQQFCENCAGSDECELAYA